MKKMLSFIFLAAFFCINALAQESILLFDSTTVVNTDGSLLVTEVITVQLSGRSRGIVREFPTRYSENLFSNYEVDFQVNQVLQDGRSAEYVIHDVANGKKIYVGNKNIILPRDRYVYKIVYATNRQLGFFPDHDELYWNVTGNGWRLPIEKVVARIILPSNIPHDAIKIAGYTGHMGERESNFSASIDKNSVTFTTTKELLPEQGLTIVVGWPKGFIAEPSWYQKTYWFIRDNFIKLWGFLGLLLLLLFYYIAHLFVRRADQQGTIIPFFYPPPDMSPSAVGFIQNFEFKDSLLGADIVDLAVQGYLTISSEQSIWRGNQYTLTRTDKEIKANDATHHYYEQLLAILFSENDSIAVNNNNQFIISRAVRACQKHTMHYEKFINREKPQNIFFVGVMSSGIWLLLLMLLRYVGIETYLAMFFAFAFVSFFVVFKYIRTYYPAGRKLADEIEGYKMFLTTTETERMKVVGTPPTKTPELYEKYLPFAMALGVEDQWSKQFAPLFKQMQIEGHPYVPMWYTGQMFGGGFSSGFANNLSTSLNSAISASTIRPGRSSGFGNGPSGGGGGSSGGGGGGGGGGTW
jgi:uncharacterized membrane protein